MTEKKISVIIPVYGIEPYLDRCVESVTKQTYTNLEIILVDDGSPDRCTAICDEWARRDDRVKVIHKANGGLSDARNAGMRVAAGELIGFVDGDDWISAEMYQCLYDNMMENDSDISACGVEMVWEGDVPHRALTPGGTYLLNQREAMEAIVRESVLKQPVWYKLYKTKLIRSIAFPVGRYHEDVFWSYRAIANAQSVSIFDTPCYYYYQRNNSIMGNQYSLKRLDALDAKWERLEYLEARFPELAGPARWDLWFSGMYAMQMSLQFLSTGELEAARQKIERMIQGVKPVRGLEDASIQSKIWFLLSQISFEKTCKLRNLLHIGP